MAFIPNVNESLGTTWESAGWVFGADHDTVAYPAVLSSIDATSPDPSTAGFVLFGAWGDGGPATRSWWRQKLYTGYTPGQLVGVHIGVLWDLDTGPGSAFLSIEGGDGTNLREYVPDSTGYSFWTIPSFFPNIVNGVLQGVADANGEVLVKIGAKDYGGSCNWSMKYGNQVIELGHFTTPEAPGVPVVVSACRHA